MRERAPPAGWRGQGRRVVEGWAAAFAGRRERDWPLGRTDLGARCVAGRAGRGLRAGNWDKRGAPGRARISELRDAVSQRAGEGAYGKVARAPHGWTMRADTRVEGVRRRTVHRNGVCEWCAYKRYFEVSRGSHRSCKKRRDMWQCSAKKQHEHSCHANPRLLMTWAAHLSAAVPAFGSR